MAKNADLSNWGINAIPLVSRKYSSGQEKYDTHRWQACKQNRKSLLGRGKCPFLHFKHAVSILNEYNDNPI